MFDRAGLTPCALTPSAGLSCGRVRKALDNRRRDPRIHDEGSRVSSRVILHASSRPTPGTEAQTRKSIVLFSERRRSGRSLAFETFVNGLTPFGGVL